MSTGYGASIQEPTIINVLENGRGNMRVLLGSVYLFEVDILIHGRLIEGRSVGANVRRTTVSAEKYYARERY